MYNILSVARSMIPFLILTFSITLPSNAQDRDAVLIYTFDNIVGDVLKDQSGNGNDGTIIGAKPLQGKFRNGLGFGGNAAQNFVEIPADTSLDMKKGITVELWVFLNAHSSAGAVGVTKTQSYKVGPRNNSKAEIRMTTTEKAWGSAVLMSNKNVSLAKWTHIAGTYDAETRMAKLYIDGELDGEKEIGGDIVPNDGVVWLGRGANPYLDGTMDDVRVSKVARTQDEIKQLMTLGIEAALSVSPQDKLATTWGNLKAHLTK